VTTIDSNDLVTVNITGLPKYESITDKLDGKTFKGNNITLTAAEVDSGLVLQSNYRGGGHPVATLTLTANAKDPVTGAVTSASVRRASLDRSATCGHDDHTVETVRAAGLTIADHTLSVAGRRQGRLGDRVTTTDHNDRVVANITGLPSYETITDKRDGNVRERTSPDGRRSTAGWCCTRISVARRPGAHT
jgi:hypothetical protein